MNIAHGLAQSQDEQSTCFDLDFTSEDFLDLAEIVRAASGIMLPEAKASLVYARLARRLRILTLPSFKSYRTFIASEHGAGERQRMIEAMTTNVTQFFREPHHFAELSSLVLPHLIRKARSGGRVRIWSAGCSSGEEPYSVAATVLSLMPDAHRFDIKILATDINSQMLARARAGIYAADAATIASVAKHEQWFLRRDIEGRPSLLVHDDLRRLVSFRTSNLIDQPWPMRGKFEAIFCRNVLIYFDTDIHDQICARLVEYLSPGGYLYLGHSERVPPVMPDINLVGATSYRFQPPGGNSRMSAEAMTVPNPLHEVK